MSTVITLAEAKSAIRLTSTAQDVYLQAVLDSLEEWLSGELQVAFTSAAAVENVSGGGTILYVSRNPVTAITSITDLTNSVVEPEANYILTDRGPERSITYSGQHWMFGRKRWAVSYTGGYATGTIPAGLKLPVLQLFARFWHNTPEMQSKGSPLVGNESWASLADSLTMQLLRPYQLGRWC